MKRIDNIHYLRGICSLLVVFTHFHLLIFNYINGSFGVDFFFLISGFVMQGTLSRYSKSISSSRISLHFILRRLLRIYPVFLLLLIPILIYQNTGLFDSLSSILFLNNYLDIEFPIFEKSKKFNELPLSFGERIKLAGKFNCDVLFFFW